MRCRSLEDRQAEHAHTNPAARSAPLADDPDVSPRLRPDLGSIIRLPTAAGNRAVSELISGVHRKTMSLPLQRCAPDRPGCACADEAAPPHALERQVDEPA